MGQDEEIVAGRRPVEEAFAARREARRLLVVPQRREALETLVLHATRLRIPVVEVEGGTLTSVTGFDGHQGVALVVAPRRWASLEDVLALAAARSEPPFVLVLDSLEDPQNLGTLLRSADACGIHGVVFPTRNAAPLTPSAVKASAGAVEHLLLVPVDDLPGALADLRARGMHVVGTDAEAPLSYRDADLRGPVALVIGSEGKGMTGPVRRRLELLVRIPMRGHVGSLNAAVAGSVLLFEAAAQRPAPAPEPPRANDGPAGEPAADAASDRAIPEPTTRSARTADAGESRPVSKRAMGRTRKAAGGEEAAGRARPVEPAPSPGGGANETVTSAAGTMDQGADSGPRASIPGSAGEPAAGEPAAGKPPAGEPPAGTAALRIPRAGPDEGSSAPREPVTDELSAPPASVAGGGPAGAPGEDLLPER